MSKYKLCNLCLSILHVMGFGYYVTAILQLLRNLPSQPWRSHPGRFTSGGLLPSNPRNTNKKGSRHNVSGAFLLASR